MRGPAHERHFLRRDHSPVTGVRKGGQRPDQGVGMTLGIVLAWCWHGVGRGVGHETGLSNHQFKLKLTIC